MCKSLPCRCNRYKQSKKYRQKEMYFLYALRKTVPRKGTQSQRPHGLHRWTGHQEVLLSSKRKSAFPLTRHFISVIFPVIYDAKAISDNFINSILLKAGLLQVGFLSLSSLAAISQPLENFQKTKKELPKGNSLNHVGINLSSQSVARQVFSAPASLTSVFDMGTGGPSP